MCLLSSIPSWHLGMLLDTGLWCGICWVKTPLRILHKWIPHMPVDQRCSSSTSMPPYTDPFVPVPNKCWRLVSLQSIRKSRQFSSLSMLKVQLMETRSQWLKIESDITVYKKNGPESIRIFKGQKSISQRLVRTFDKVRVLLEFSNTVSVCV